MFFLAVEPVIVGSIPLTPEVVELWARVFPILAKAVSHHRT